MDTTDNETTNTQSNPAPTRVEATSEVEQEWSYDRQRGVIKQFFADHDEYQVIGTYADIADEARRRDPLERPEFSDEEVAS